MYSLLYHTPEPYLAFYIFITLVEDYQLCDIYDKDLRGVTKHCKAITMLINWELPNLHLHFTRNVIDSQMFAMDWILTLYSVLIPYDCHHIFLTNFMKEGWIYFYKVVLNFLKSIEKELCNEDELCDVLITLKTLATPARNWGVSPPWEDKGLIEYFKNIFWKKKEEINWEGHLE